MGHLSTILSLLLLSPLPVYCRDPSCPSACDTATWPFQYIGGVQPSMDDWVMQCTALLPVQTRFLCYRKYCIAKEIEAGWQAYNGYCKDHASIDLLPLSIINSITREMELTYPSMSKNAYQRAYHAYEREHDETAIYHKTPISVSPELFYQAVKTTKAWEESQSTRALYSYAMYGFWGIVLLCGMGFRFYNHIVTAYYDGALPRPTRHPTFQSRCRRFIKQYITTPTLFNYHCADPRMPFTVPARLQSWTIISFLIINIVLNCVSFETFPGNLYWETGSDQIWRYIAGRSGGIATANLPLVFAFAMRNNVLIWLTGWSFETYNQFHRWIARIATVEAIVHSIAWTVPEVENGYYSYQWSQRYWIAGGVATIVMSLLCLSIYPFRKRLYEVFLLLHIIFAIALLVGIWYHLEVWDGEYNGYFWPCFVVWGFDRVLRLARLLILNMRSRSAVATYGSNSDIIRLNIPASGLQILEPAPGQYYYIYAMKGFKIWENHPFTLSKWILDDTNSLSFMIQPKTSFTRRLRDNITSGRTPTNDNILSTRKIRVAIEGPYGKSYNLSHYESLLFIMGGSGITVGLAGLCSIYNEMSSSSLKKMALKRIHLVWAVRSIAMFEDILEQELEPWLTSPTMVGKVSFRIDAYVTRGRRMSIMVEPKTPDSGSTSDFGGNKKTVLALSQSSASPTSILEQNCVKEAADNIIIKVKALEGGFSTPSSSSGSSTPHRNTRLDAHLHEARPDIVNIIQETGLQAYANRERLAVMCCGPASMADDARAGVVQTLAKGKSENKIIELDFFNESFNW